MSVEPPSSMVEKSHLEVNIKNTTVLEKSEFPGHVSSNMLRFYFQLASTFEEITYEMFHSFRVCRRH